MKKLIVRASSILASILLLAVCLIFLVPYVREKEPSLFSTLMIPSSLASLLFVLLAVVTVCLLAFRVRSKGIAKTFPLLNYFLALAMVLAIYLIDYVIPLAPYGTFVVTIVSLLLQISIYAILLPYLFTAQVCFLFLLLRGKLGTLE